MPVNGLIRLLVQFLVSPDMEPLSRFDCILMELRIFQKSQLNHLVDEIWKKRVPCPPPRWDPCFWRGRWWPPWSRSLFVSDRGRKFSMKIYLMLGGCAGWKIGSLIRILWIAMELCGARTTNFPDAKLRKKREIFPTHFSHFPRLAMSGPAWRVSVAWEKSRLHEVRQKTVPKGCVRSKARSQRESRGRYSRNLGPSLSPSHALHWLLLMLTPSMEIVEDKTA